MSKDSESGSPMSDRMSSLLSDAVGDREQVNAALDDVRDRLGELTEHLSTLGQRVDTALKSGGGGKRATVSADLSSVDARLEVLQNDMTALGGEVAGLVEAATVDRASVRAAVEAAESVANRSVRVEEVASALAEIRDGLVGPGGLALQVRQIAEDMAESGPDIGDRLDEVVQTAIRESEARMRAHVDDAVYALAEALLRRRPARGGQAPAGLDTAGTGLSVDSLDPTPSAAVDTASSPAAVLSPASLPVPAAAPESSAAPDPSGPTATAVTAVAPTDVAPIDEVSDDAATPVRASGSAGASGPTAGWMPQGDSPEALADGPRDYEPDPDTLETRLRPGVGTPGLAVDIDESARTVDEATVGQPVRPARRIDVSAEVVPTVRTLRSRESGDTSAEDPTADEVDGSAEPAAAGEPRKRAWFRSTD